MVPAFHRFPPSSTSESQIICSRQFFSSYKIFKIVFEKLVFFESNQIKKKVHTVGFQFSRLYKILKKQTNL